MLYNKLNFLKYILLPFQIIYSIIILIRNILYNTNTLHIFHARPLIISIGNLVPDSVKKGDVVYFDRHAGHGITFNETRYHVIQVGDVVLVA